MLFLMVMVACGNDTTSTNKPEKEKEPAQTETASADTEKESEPPAEETSDSEQEADIEGLGHIKTVAVGYNDEVGLDGSDSDAKPIEMGSMKLTVNGLAVVDVAPQEDMKVMFNGQDNVRAIVIDMIAENTAEEDITFNPNQAILVTDTGEQVESEIGMMGDAGGDFLGKVVKEGQSWWLLKDLDKDVKKVTMIISPPFTTSDWSETAKEKRIEFEVLPWEEALKKDGKK